MKLSRYSRRQNNNAGGEQPRSCRGCGKHLSGTRWGYQEVCSKPECHGIVLARMEKRLA
ncbi:hypothetical protein [Pseudonocardia sp. WMMC193]|uniref:hypothetical protein n=1 Tax=Pseudonocardia sp. WMMC193 TaxID=2911965 RepID=UPI001F24479D|nr:hypothetical protein [Pseudonocardia sp. WMMC193]MCF7547322.1 hypothetical protein [Pseudonocardia sp. WMMC193]